jgi:hypothetical protein
MTQHALGRVASALLAGMLLWSCPVSAQSLTTSVKGEPIIRRAVAPPSSDFTTYIEGELVRVSIPSNWRELPGSNAVTFAPEGAYGNAGVKSVFTHGVGMGLARNDKRNLRVTTDDFIASSVLVNPSAGQTFRYGKLTIGDRPGLHTILSTVSEATGEPERIEIFTTLLNDDTLFYVLAVTPRDRASDYTGTFQRVVRSIEIIDCDPRALVNRQVPAAPVRLCSEHTQSVTR